MTSQLGLLDEFAIQAGESGRIIALFTVSDLDLTNEEANYLTIEDREILRELIMQELNWSTAIYEAVEMWRMINNENDEGEVDD